MGIVKAITVAATLLYVTTAQRPLVDKVRLVNGTNTNSTGGRVEVLVGGVWGTVCDDAWDDQDAGVVCRSLGLTGGIPLRKDTSPYGPGSGPIHMDNTDCQGDEHTVGDCGFAWGSQVNCDHSEDAGVECSPPLLPGQTLPPPAATVFPPANLLQNNCSAPHPSLRLVGNYSGVGYVQVRAPNGTFGYVCDDKWDFNAAKVVCEELCYTYCCPEPDMDLRLAVSLPQPVQYVLDDVQCDGTESSLADCVHKPWFSHNCGLSEMAAVTCIDIDNPTPTGPDLTLVCIDGEMIAKFSLLSDPDLEAKHLTIADPYTGPCSLRKNTTTDFIVVYISYNECGTVAMENATHIIYRNALHMEATTRQGAITRVSEYRVELTCEIPRNATVHRVMEPRTELVTQRAMGQFNVTMYIYQDSLCRVKVTLYPYPIDLGQWISYAVELHTTDPQLKLVVTDCVAKASLTNSSFPSYPLYKNKCKVEPTLRIIPLNMTRFGFTYQTFKFVGYRYVVIQCDVIICLEQDVTSECDRSCNSTKPTPSYAGRRRRDASSHPILTVTSPPVDLESSAGSGAHWQSPDPNRAPTSAGTTSHATSPVPPSPEATKAAVQKTEWTVTPTPTHTTTQSAIPTPEAASTSNPSDITGKATLVLLSTRYELNAKLGKPALPLQTEATTTPAPSWLGAYSTWWILVDGLHNMARSDDQGPLPQQQRAISAAVCVSSSALVPSLLSLAAVTLCCL